MKEHLHCFMARARWYNTLHLKQIFQSERYFSLLLRIPSWLGIHQTNIHVTS